MNEENRFEIFYQEKHSGRSLTYLYISSTAVVNTLFCPKSYSLSVSCYQAAILMCFNKQEVLTITEIQELTLLPEQELARQLKELCNPKARIINKENLKVPKFESNEKLSVNVEFQNKLIKLSYIPKSSHKKKEVGEKTDINNKVDEEIKSERGMVIDAMIVRIMKARKKELHVELMNEVMKQVSLFKPQPQMIKQSIERLIEKEYLTRDQNDRKIYIYIP